MSKRVLFYASVKTRKMFSLQQFYRTDIELLKELGFEVKLSNRLLDFLCFSRYEIAFLYFYRYGFFAGLFAKILGKKVYFTGGIDYLSKDYSPYMRFMIQKVFFRLCYIVSDKCILVSDADKKNVLLHFPGLNKEKLPLVNHSIDTVKYALSENVLREKMILTTSWMLSVENVIRKGVDSSIRVFSELVKLDKDYRMVIIGPTGEGTDYLKLIIAELNLDSVVAFTGAVTEEHKLDYLSRSETYLQLSKYEGFGLAAIEALACGCLVVHTNAGGLKHGVGDHGIVVDLETDSFEHIAKSLLSITANQERVKAMRQKGYDYVKNNFDNKVRLEGLRALVGVG